MSGPVVSLLLGMGCLAEDSLGSLVRLLLECPCFVGDFFGAFADNAGFTGLTFDDDAVAASVSVALGRLSLDVGVEDVWIGAAVSLLVVCPCVGVSVGVHVSDEGAAGVGLAFLDESALEVGASDSLGLSCPCDAWVERLEVGVPVRARDVPVSVLLPESFWVDSARWELFVDVVS